jgi:hypothetical protein
MDTGLSVPGMIRLEREFAKELLNNIEVKNELSDNSMYLNKRFCLHFETDQRRGLVVRVSDC